MVSLSKCPRDPLDPREYYYDCKGKLKVVVLLYLESSRQCNNFESIKSEKIENHQWKSLDPIAILANQLELSLETIYVEILALTIFL